MHSDIHKEFSSKLDDTKENIISTSNKTLKTVHANRVPSFAEVTLDQYKSWELNQSTRNLMQLVNPAKQQEVAEAILVSNYDVEGYTLSDQMCWFIRAIG